MTGSGGPPHNAAGSAPPQTTPAVLNRIDGARPNHDALITDEKTLTFAGLRHEVRRAAGAMVELGVAAGDRVAIWSPNTCGRPIADFELRIDNPDEHSGAGEVLLRGPNVMLGYLDDPEATSATIDTDGWLHTGDIENVDAAGNLRITDRLKDMYICGGFNVYPAEIEQVLARLPGVAEAAVIGVPDERLGEVGKALIVRLPGSDLDERAVIAYSREHLANFKLPRSVEFIDSLPRNLGGKVVKPELRERV